MAAGADGKFDPIHQFEPQEIFNLVIGGYDVSFTTSSLFMVLSAGLTLIFLLFASSGRALIPGRWQSMAEMTYEFVANMVRENVGKDGMHFFPFVFALFMFILLANLLGLLPGSFTFTSQIIVTFALSMLVMAVVVGYGVYKNGFKFLKVFWPSGIPLAVNWLVCLIEIISFISRPLSLSVRLFANMLAGHITLKVFASFIVSLAGAHSLGFLGSILPLAMTVGLTALETLVAVLQAYVFAVLTSIYLHDAVHPGH